MLAKMGSKSLGKTSGRSGNIKMLKGLLHSTPWWFNTAAVFLKS
jgi:hypothetical protein